MKRRNKSQVVAVGQPVGLPSTAGIAGTAGWAAIPGTLAPWQQVGAFAGSRLNQFPAYIPGVQLHSGREWGNSDWYYPTRTYLPNGSVQQTQQAASDPGGQRYGSTFTGPIGPLSAKRNAAAVTAAQVRQSGMQNLAWAQGLSE